MQRRLSLAEMSICFLGPIGIYSGCVVAGIDAGVSHSRHSWAAAYTVMPIHRYI